MGRYLVVAHQTATSRELLDQLRQLVEEDSGAVFTLVVPATRDGQGMTWTEGQALAAAGRTGEDAADMMRRLGLNVQRTMVGDESPVEAISDALRDSGPYAAIVISTLPPGLSRWLKLDVHNRARQKFNLPVISVVAAREAAQAGGRP